MKSDLERAGVYYRKGRFARVIRLLEPQVFQHRENFTFYYFLGMSCIRTGDMQGARTYLDRALGLKPFDERTLAGLAVVHLKLDDVTEAVQCYLDILDNDSKHKLAARGLKVIRRNTDKDRLAPISASDRILKLLPKERSPSRWLIPVVAALAVATVVAGYFGYRLKERRNPRREEVAILSIGAIQDLSVTGTEVQYEMTDREIEKTFSSAKRYFSNFRDNLALREINRLYLSNASQAVKEHARIIAGFIDPPDFTTITDPFAYEKVAAEPDLHRGTYVVWRGRTSNIVFGSDAIVFDLLVGYDTNRILEGVVPVEFDTGIDLANGRSVEVLGEVNLIEGGIALRALAIHRLAVD